MSTKDQVNGKASLVQLYSTFCGPWMRKEFQSRESGKGGHHSEYNMKIYEKEFRRHITRTIADSMMREFPEETQEVLKEMIGK